MLEPADQRALAEERVEPFSYPALPDAVIATRSDASSPWCYGSARRETDLHWRIRTTSEGTLRNRDTAIVRFDAVIEPGARLCDPSFAVDRQTKTELCLDALSNDALAGQLSAHTLASRLRDFDGLLRWRASNGFCFFSSLSAPDLYHFVNQVVCGKRSGGNNIAAVSVLPAHPETSLLAAARVCGSAVCQEQSEAGQKQMTAFVPETSSAKTSVSPVSEQTIREHLAVWTWLRRASINGVLGADRLTFDPCPEGTVSRLATALGTQGSRTPTLTPESFLRVLGVSCEWITKEGPAVVALLNPGSCNNAAVDEVDGALPAMQAGYLADAGLVDRVRYLMAACAVVIGGFAARRAGEVGSLKAGCISHESDGAWISIYIEKTDRAVRRIPVPHSVVLAVETLEALSASYRHSTNQPWIFNVLIPGCDKPLVFRSDTDLKAFARACGLHSGPHALTSPLASHQLRRGFSICFYHAFRLGSLSALQRMLRHTDPASTGIYVTEAVTGDILRLADRLRARFDASMNAMPPEQQSELTAELKRLESLAASGTSLDRSRCEHAALLLLQAWRRDWPSRERDVMHKLKAAERRVVAGIRLGSQLAPGRPPSAGLLERAREYARLALFQ